MDLNALREAAIEATSRALHDKHGFVPGDESDEWEGEYRRQFALLKQRIGTVPVNFLSDLDITGGNSGSPVLDAEGKLVGLAFDGNWESVASNWVFDPVMTRMISVDQRYMRWIMQEAYPAPQVLKELDVAPKN